MHPASRITRKDTAGSAELQVYCKPSQWLLRKIELDPIFFFYFFLFFFIFMFYVHVQPYGL